MTGRAVVTGATSFIGVHLVETLLSCHDEVVAILRPDSKSGSQFKERFGERVRIVSMDMSEYDAMHNYVPNCDYFVHLAWDGTRGEARLDSGLQEQNYRASLVALQSAFKMGAKAFVSAGSQAEYGQQSGVVSEDSPSEPYSEYGKNKWRFYQEAESLCNRQGVKLYEPRFFSLYGKGDFPGTMIISTVGKMMRNEECSFTDCQQMWNYLHVRDAVAGVAHLLHTEAPGGIYNFGSQDTRRLRSYIEEMAKLTQTKSMLKFGVIPHNDSGRDGIQPDVGKILATGWRPKVSFAEGIYEIMQTVQDGE